MWGKDYNAGKDYNVGKVTCRCLQMHNEGKTTIFLFSCLNDS